MVFTFRLFIVDINIGLLVLAGLLTFFIIEKIATISQQSSSNNSHSHSHSHAKKNTEDKKNNDEKEKQKKEIAHHDEPIKVGGILNIIADTTHNFTGKLGSQISFFSEVFSKKKMEWRLRLLF